MNDVRAAYRQVLRSLRAFRVVRIFGRLGSLRDIVFSLAAALGPVLNAFLIMLIISSICARPPEIPAAARIEGGARGEYHGLDRVRRRAVMMLTARLPALRQSACAAHGSQR